MTKHKEPMDNFTVVFLDKNQNILDKCEVSGGKKDSKHWFGFGRMFVPQCVSIVFEKE